MKPITFNDLPEAVSNLLVKLENIEQLLKARSKEVTAPELRFLSIDEAGMFLNLAKATIYGLVSQNKIPYMKQGKKLYFSKEKLIQWVLSGRNKTQEEITAGIDRAIVNAKNKGGKI